MPSWPFFFLPRKRAIHTWTTKHPIFLAIQNGSMILPIGWAFRWPPLSSAYLRTSWTQVSTEVYRPDCHFSRVPLLLFRILALLISRRSMLGECQGAILPFGIQRMCRSRRNICSCPFMVRASTFLLISPGLFVQPFTTKITSCRFFFLWDLFAAEASVKRERPFGTPVLRRLIKIRVKR